MHLLQSLLCSPQSRGIGHSTTQYTYHIGQRHACHHMKAQSHCRAHQDHSKCKHIQCHTSLPERTEKTRPDLQSQGINKNNQSETLGIIQHLGIYRQAEMSGRNSGKKNKSNPQRNPVDADLSQSQS